MAIYYAYDINGYGIIETMPGEFSEEYIHAERNLLEDIARRCTGLKPVYVGTNLKAAEASIKHLKTDDKSRVSLELEEVAREAFAQSLTANAGRRQN